MREAGDCAKADQAHDEKVTYFVEVRDLSD